MTQLDLTSLPPPRAETMFPDAGPDPVADEQRESLPVPAGGLIRTLSYLTDLACVVAVAGPLWRLLYSPVLTGIAIAEVVAVLTLLRARTGRTPGGLISGTIAVANGSDHAPGLKRQLVRTTLMVLLHVTVVGPLVVSFFSRDGRDLVDRVAGTAVLDLRAEQSQPDSGNGDEKAEEPFPRKQENPGFPVPGAPASPPPLAPVPPPLTPVAPPLTPASPPSLAPVAPPLAPASPPPLAPVPPPPIVNREKLETPQRPEKPLAPAASPLTPRRAASREPALAAPSGNTESNSLTPRRAAPLPPTPPKPSPPSAGPSGLPGAVQVWLVVDSGQRERVDSVLVVGREPTGADGERHVVIPDPTHSISRTHLRLGPASSGVWVEDAASTNGTVVRNAAGAIAHLARGRRTLLPLGTTIIMGGRTMMIVGDSPQ